MERPLLLTGFMATGKSTVGRLVAERTGRPFVDLDGRIEARAGRSVREIFAADGEPAFRRLEAEELAKVLADDGAPVVALGGGALLQREARLEALDRAIVVTLEASCDEILRRAVREGDSRPLLNTTDPKPRIVELLDARSRAYGESHLRLQTDSVDPTSLADTVAETWKRDPIAVAAGADSYAVEVGTRIADERLPPLVGSAPLAFLITDDNVAKHHAAPIERALGRCATRTAVFVLPAGEEHKTPASLERIWKSALAASADRKSLVIGLGGGVVTDIAGFAAATYMRGLRWIALPTTLLAMVDAAVGGKTAVDLPDAKNAVGAFWQPAGVLCDVAHLSTEPERGFTSALAEVVKTALIGDPTLLEILEARPADVRTRNPELVVDMVKRCIRVKARIVSFDARESGLRATLNLGHTIGHALEAYDGYGNLRHGEAISLGLVAALRIGEKLRLTDAALTARVTQLLAALGLPVDLASQPVAQAAQLIGNDKKRSGNSIRFIAARDVGRVELHDLPIEDLRALARALH